MKSYINLHNILMLNIGMDFSFKSFTPVMFLKSHAFVFHCWMMWWSDTCQTHSHQLKLLSIPFSDLSSAVVLPSASSQLSDCLPQHKWQILFFFP